VFQLKQICAEECGCRSDGEMGRFVQIAMGSGAELSCHLLLARDLNLITASEYALLSNDTTEVLRMLSALSEKLKRPAVDRSSLTAKG
jgi:four helix bundle protein